MRPKNKRREAGDKMGVRDKDKSNPPFNMRIKLFTDEVFPLQNITADMKISDLKKYVEFATGVPVHLQRISYLDEGNYFKILGKHTFQREEKLSSFRFDG
jgi:hypothetical protein